MSFFSGDPVMLISQLECLKSQGFTQEFTSQLMLLESLNRLPVVWRSRKLT